MKNKKFKNVILVRPKYIRIERNWLMKKAKPLKPFESVAFQFFPDLKAIAQILKKAGADRSGISGKGSMLYGLFQKQIDQKSLKRKLDKKSDFIWTGKTCKGKLKLID